MRHKSLIDIKSSDDLVLVIPGVLVVVLLSIVAAKTQDSSSSVGVEPIDLLRLALKDDCLDNEEGTGS